MRTLEGLTVPGLTPAARREALVGLSDAALAKALTDLARALADVDAEPLARAASLPLGEVLASPFALRAVALGVSRGVTTRHIELGTRIDWTLRFGHEDVFDPDHDQWIGGVLKTGKYLGFTADAPFASFDPSYVSKWGPHEMLHRAAGYFFSRGASRFDHYLGARLNELVPVVAFYGPEQALRLDEGAFDRAHAGEHPEADVTRARWRTLGSDALDVHASGEILRAGVHHFERELRAIDEEVETGRRVRVPHPLLDASSDATAYVVGHYDRLRDANVASVLAADEEAEPDLARYRAKVEQLFDDLLFSTLHVDFDEAARARARRGERDLLHRAAHRVDVDLTDALAAHARGDSVSAWLADHLETDDLAAILRDGSTPAVHAITEGLRETAPVLFEMVQDELLDRFCSSDAVWARAPLLTRFERFLSSEKDLDAARDMLRLETAIVRSRRDDGIERLSMPVESLPDPLLEGAVIASDAFDVLTFACDVLALHAAVRAGEPVYEPLPENITVLAGGYFDEVSFVPIPDAVRAAFEAARAGTIPVATFLDRLEAELDEPDGDAESWLRALLEAGALGYRG